MEELTLVIMAAGMGSRFGGLKQIEPVGPSNEIIADYSVYDAIKAGFNKVIFVIKEENLEYFKNNITSKYQDKIKVEFAFQRLDNVPVGTVIPENRVKMWGTSHALYSAKDKINGSFALINADDFYGFDSFKRLVEFFKRNNNPYDNIMVGYPISSVISDKGLVKRGICILENNQVKSLIESEVGLVNDVIVAKSLMDGTTMYLEKNHPTSLSCFGFKKSFLDFLETDYYSFFKSKLDEKSEFILTETIRKNLENGNMNLLYESSTGKWLGVTYKDDLDIIKKEILNLVEKGVYKNNLWED
ncbi:MAG: sugar phosphate nucleotidyltransferase [Bacilli bacterium]